MNTGFWVIYKKEVKSLFLSPTFYMMCVPLCVIFGWNFGNAIATFAQASSMAMMQQGVSPQQTNIHYGVFLRHLSVVNLILILIVPAITMRLISEERKLRSFDLLLTSPVTSFDIVFGKFMAGLTGLFGVLAVAFVYPLSTAMLTTFQWPPLIIASLGIFLVGGVYVAMNLFCSSLTESSLIAFVGSIVMNISIWFIGQALEHAESSGLRSVLEHLSMSTHLSGIVEGTIRSQGIVFLVSVMVLFVFLSERVVESMRWRA
jgi:ABC-2 type transport system permease protein